MVKVNAFNDVGPEMRIQRLPAPAEISLTPGKSGWGNVGSRSDRRSSTVDTDPEGRVYVGAGSARGFTPLAGRSIVPADQAGAEKWHEHEIDAVQAAVDSSIATSNDCGIMAEELVQYGVAAKIGFQATATRGLNEP